MGRTDRVTDSIARPGAILPSINQGIYEESTTARAKLGSRMDLGDGRVFYYALNGATVLAPGKLVCSPVVATEKETNMAQAETVGSKQIDMVAVGTITADQYAEGYMSVVNDTGEGQTYKIRGNSAASAAAVCTVYLYDEIKTALDTTSEVIITPNILRGVILNTTSSVTSFVCGVPLFAVTAANYFWLQTWGPCSVLCGDSLGNAVTERCCIATGSGEFLSTAGSVTGHQQIGYQIYSGTDVVDTEYHLIYLTIMP